MIGQSRKAANYNARLQMRAALSEVFLEGVVLGHVVTFISKARKSTWSRSASLGHLPFEMLFSLGLAQTEAYPGLS
jgi:undecaprenyl pyrophosphate phosphatase UppP